MSIHKTRSMYVRGSKVKTDNELLDSRAALSNTIHLHVDRCLRYAWLVLVRLDVFLHFPCAERVAKYEVMRRLLEFFICSMK